MNPEEITQKLQKIDVHFRTQDQTMSERERLFSRIVKLNEEVGELCEAVLSENDTNQRNKEKEIDLDNELADVMICTLLIAQNREVNIWETLDKKLQKQFTRFNIE